MDANARQCPKLAFPLQNTNFLIISNYYYIYYCLNIFIICEKVATNSSEKIAGSLLKLSLKEKEEAKRQRSKKAKK